MRRVCCGEYLQGRPAQLLSLELTSVSASGTDPRSLARALVPAAAGPGCAQPTCLSGLFIGFARLWHRGRALASIWLGWSVSFGNSLGLLRRFSFAPSYGAIDVRNAVEGPEAL